jgi:hypothetical protein
MLDRITQINNILAKKMEKVKSIPAGQLMLMCRYVDMTFFGNFKKFKRRYSTRVKLRR